MLLAFTAFDAAYTRRKRRRTPRLIFAQRSTMMPLVREDILLSQKRRPHYAAVDGALLTACHGLSGPPLRARCAEAQWMRPAELYKAG